MKAMNKKRAIFFISGSLTGFFSSTNIITKTGLDGACKVRGNIVGQIQALYGLSRVSQIGCSKHKAKEFIRSSGTET